MDKHKILDLEQRQEWMPFSGTAPKWDDQLASLYQCQDIESFPSVCLEMVLTLLAASAGSFFIWDEACKEFLLKAAVGPYRNVARTAHIKLREGILGWVGGQGTSVLVKNIHADQRFQTVKRLGHYKSYSFISVPLLSNHKLIGVINITERPNFEPFSEEDLQIVQSLAAHMATAYARLKYQAQLIAENRNLQQALVNMRLEQKNSESFVQLGKLAANLAHELNNPMDAIRRYVNLAMDKTMEDSLAKEYLGKTKKAIRRAIRIIHNLLEFASSSKSARFVEVHDIINRSLEAFDHHGFENIEIQRNFCNTPSYLPDHGISMVLDNLYRNARHSMGNKGILTVTTYRSECSISVVVEDTGNGIPSHVRPRLFESLFSTKIQGEGTGIGLALCKELVERSGGTIRFDESLRTGARFTITLPCQDKGGINREK